MPKCTMCNESKKDLQKVAKDTNVCLDCYDRFNLYVISWLLLEKKAMQDMFEDMIKRQIDVSKKLQKDINSIKSRQRSIAEATDRRTQLAARVAKMRAMQANVRRNR